MKDMGREGDFGGRWTRNFHNAHYMNHWLILFLKYGKSHNISVYDFVKRYGLLAHKSRQLKMLEFILSSHSDMYSKIRIIQNQPPFLV